MGRITSSGRCGHFAVLFHQLVGIFNQILTVGVSGLLFARALSHLVATIAVTVIRKNTSIVHAWGALKILVISSA